MFSIDGNLSVDLLEISEVNENGNLYATAVVQVLFTMKELFVLDPIDKQDVERYQTLRGKCLFSLLG
jgi:hypothetical protein